jgi:hypothetical protein
MMFNNRRIKVGNLCVRPRINVPVLLEENFVSYKFFRRACGTNGDFFYDSKFDGNTNLDSGGNFGHVSFFKSIKGGDRVIEPVYMP